MKIVNTEKLVIKSWCNSPEDGAIEQAKNLANLPFAYHHVALMPDTHQGYGMPIGGVLATHNVIVPNAVGVDIGCGMCAVRSNIKVEDFNQELLKKIFGGSAEYKGGIRALIPVGMNHQKEDKDWIGFDNAPDIEIIQQELKSSRRQLGTLGGGNHFIEVQAGDDGYIWIMIHSGSRNFGYKIAGLYNKKAQELCNKWYSNIPAFKGEDGLAFLPIDTTEGKEYITAMNYALDFAYANRLHMIKDCQDEFKKVIDCTFDDVINVHHNYARIEHHFGKDVWVHRKGATSARLGEAGLIPGSQGTASYIVTGKGNQDSFMSCSHGAGRAMSRTKAQDNLSVESEIQRLNDMGVLHAIRTKKDLDEAPSAYKDIDIVMDEQKDLVDIKTRLRPLGVIKG